LIPMLEDSKGRPVNPPSPIRRVLWTCVLLLAGLVLVYLGIVLFHGMRAKKAYALFQDENSAAKPSLVGLPSIEPMTKEQALILEEIDGLAPTKIEVSKILYGPDVARYWPHDVMFYVDYVGRNKTTNSSETVTVWVNQFPNEAWALYFAKHSLLSDLVPRNRSLVLSLSRKFGNDIVVDRQFRFQDETGRLLFFWPSGKTLVTVIYYCPTLSEEFLRRYLKKYPSSL
jgi:hypothetical protein